MRLVHLSDVHEKWQKLSIPECDVLVSSGDYSFQGKPDVVKRFHEWLWLQPAKHIISVQGNHEVWVEKNFQEAKAIAEEACPGVHFIEEGEVIIDGVKFWGSAITPWFMDWAWNRSIDEIKRHWDRIPDDVNVLVTHGPPYKILDELVFADGTPNGRYVGCPHLWDRILQLNKLKLHLFGHIHCGYGHKELNGVHFYNSAICDEMYFPGNAPFVIDI